MDEPIEEITDETRAKLRDFDEDEAYFLLLEIFSYAQATQDYTKFQIDLREWQARYRIDLFSEKYRYKLKYMLSNEFLDTVLKNFVAFDTLSKKNPEDGLEKMRKIFDKAEEHKSAKTLDNDLKKLYEEFPLHFLKDKYPHIVSQLLSKANRERVLQKLNDDTALSELENIISHPENYMDGEEFKNTMIEWHKLFPTEDFKPENQDRVNRIFEEYDDRKIEDLYPAFELNAGTVIPIELQPILKDDTSIVCKDAIYDFLKIANRNMGDVNSLFDWLCKYKKYINGFDDSSKEIIVKNLMNKYSAEFPHIGSNYMIPKMDSTEEDLLSLNDYKSLGDTKKNAILQFLGILYTGSRLSPEDNYRLDIINTNTQKVKMIKKAKIEPKLDLFMEKFPEDKLTAYQNVELKNISNESVDLSVSGDVSLTVGEKKDKLSIQKTKIHNDNSSAFKDSLKVAETIDNVNASTSSSNNSEGGASGGGTSSAKAVVLDNAKGNEDVSENTSDKEEKKETANSNIEAVILESEPIVEKPKETFEEVPVKEETPTTEAINSETVKEQPVEEATTTTEPTNNEAVKEQPVEKATTTTEPTNNEAVKEQPVEKENPTTETTNNETAKELPVEKATTTTVPVNNEDVKELPVEEKTITEKSNNKPKGIHSAKEDASKDVQEKDVNSSEGTASHTNSFKSFFQRFMGRSQDDDFNNREDR